MGKLPIDKISPEEFNCIRREYLDLVSLNHESLQKISELFNIASSDNPRSRDGVVACDKMHAHSYSCLCFEDRASAVVYSLLDEVYRYQSKLNQVITLPEKLRESMHDNNT